MNVTPHNGDKPANSLIRLEEFPGLILTPIVQTFNVDSKSSMAEGVRMKQTLAILLAFVGALVAHTTQSKSTAGRVDQLLDAPGLRGVASVRVESAIFFGVWTETPRDQALKIYGMKRNNPTVQLIDEFKDDGVPWQSVTAIQDSAIVGFQVRRATGEGWCGATLIYFYVGGHFRKVFESGDVAELFDLTGDGYPHMLEYRGDIQF